MSCDCHRAAARDARERAVLRRALGLNATMLVAGAVVGLAARSSGVLADALDMGADACAYALALLAVARGGAFRQRSARASGAVLLLLGLAILADVVRRALGGHDPEGPAMIAYGGASLAVNVAVLRALGPLQTGEVHLRAAWLFTRADVVASVSLLAAGLATWALGLGVADLLVGFAVGAYVVREALGILREAGDAPAADAGAAPGGTPRVRCGEDTAPAEAGPAEAGRRR